ncbi:MAG TPA: 2-oxoglutarate dehydrogenase, E2 component, dihydrolipoamide succinyltransferase [Acidobacteriaceae bacterium]
MATDVVMPQMGESIFEGTVTKWLKKPGDRVERDEPLFEISTDKVDAEIPSPTAGVLNEIKVQEGATVQINTIVAVIGETAAAEAPTTPAAPPPPAPAAPAAAAETPAPAEPDAPAATDVVMPQMGESIFEGTITKWLKQVGDKVERDEPLFEISTDKVDAEIPSPVAGVLQAIEVEAGSTVQINTVVARVGASAKTPPAKSTAVPTAPTDPALHSAATGPTAARDEAPPTPVDAPGERLRSSPLVRRMAKDHDLDLARVPGSGSAGRITKEDVLSYLSKGAPAQAMPAPAPAPTPAPAAPAPAAAATPAPSAAKPASPGELVPMTRMRSIIAQRMVESKRTNAHVHTVFKIDFTRIVRLREKEKSKYEQRNAVKLTYMPFISRAVIATLRKMPIINASLEGDAIRYHANINLGIAVALDWGLIVPVIKQAEERSFLGVARAIADVAERARSKKLKPDEVGTSTFTLTNAGIYGEQFGTPVINMPESAILGIGGLFKEPAVLTDDAGNDSIAIRHMIHLTLGFDHRIIDGSDAGKFMAEVKKYLENWSEDIG